MAQAGYTPIQLYYSTTAAATPTAANLLPGELAINITDGKLYYEDNAGVVQTIAYKNVPLNTVTGTLAVANGGTGATTNSAARTNLGASTLGSNIFTITNPSAITFPRFNADNTVSALSAADFRTAIGAGTGGGTVSSVAFSTGTTGLTVSGSPITTSGTITLAGTLAVANGGTGQSSLTSNNVILGNGTSAVQFVAPGTNGNVLTSNGTTWTSAAAPTFSQVYPSAGIAVSTGTAWGTSKTSPTGNIVGTSDTQTLTNKTISGANNTLTVDGTNDVGFRSIPQNSQSAAYTAVLADSGKQIFHPSADTTARTFTIPANSSVAYPIGTALTFINQNGAGVVTIAITSDTMRLAGAGTTGSRTLAANGIATAIKITSTEWIISGTGLT